MDDAPFKADDGVVTTAASRRSSGYKSWKKKYRKMRIVFDQKMQQGEELHRREDKASATVKRLAIENDQLLELLVEVNNSPQIPPERRIDVSLTPPSPRRDPAVKHLDRLLGDVPHSSYKVAKEARPPYMTDLVAAEGDARPANFLSPDDIDNYLQAVDAAIEASSRIPSLAPRGRSGGPAAQHPHLKNPTSVTNWLRKHAPKIFLQDGEHGATGGAEADDADGAPVSAGGAGSSSHPAAGGRKAGGSGGAGGGSGSGAAHHGSSRAERGSAKASSKTKRAVGESRRGGRGGGGGGAGGEGEGHDEEGGTAGGQDALATPSNAAARGKRKRDDDPGYRPGGGSTVRPSKKKRKSDGPGGGGGAGGAESTPIPRRSRKDKESQGERERDKDKEKEKSRDRDNKSRDKEKPREKEREKERQSRVVDDGEGGDQGKVVD